MWHCHQIIESWIPEHYFRFILNLIKRQLQVWHSQQQVQSNRCLLSTAYLTANLSSTSMSYYQWQDLIQTKSTQCNYRINRIPWQSYASMFSLFFRAKESLCSIETNTLSHRNLPDALFCPFHKPSELVLNSKPKNSVQSLLGTPVYCKQHSVNQTQLHVKPGFSFFEHISFY